MFVYGPQHVWQTLLSLPSVNQLKLNPSKTELQSWISMPMSSSCDLPGQDLSICHFLQPWGNHGQPNVFASHSLTVLLVFPLEH